MPLVRQLPFPLENRVARGPVDRPDHGMDCMVSFQPCVFSRSAPPFSITLAAPLACAPPGEHGLVVVFVRDHAVAMGIHEPFDDVPHTGTDGRRALEESFPGIVEDRPAGLPDEEGVILFDRIPLS